MKEYLATSLDGWLVIHWNEFSDTERVMDRDSEDAG